MSRLSPFSLKTAFGVFLAISIIVYGAIKTKDLFLGPKILVLSPKNGSVILEPVTIIEGEVTRTRSMTINGKGVAIEDGNRFREFIVLHLGVNEVVLKATDHFDKESMERIEVVLKE